MARTLIRLTPSRPRRGDVMEVQATLAHPMETGFRPDDNGRVLARDTVHSFSCDYNGQRVFSARLHPAVAANPYLAFSFRAQASGLLRLQWVGDNGFSQTEDVPVELA
ncbi:MAG: hypothetical protein RLZZ401_846 [Pseudomonadota bacterium]|jgi:sulfur-oxidizing protein SoxZ